MSHASAPSQIERCGIWLIANVLLTAAVAWVAFQIQQEGIAPAALFPLAVGTLLGAGGLAIWRVVRAPSRRIALAGAIVWGLLVVVGQDYIGHRYRVRHYDDELARQDPLVAAAMAQDFRLRPTFAEHLASRVRAHGAWWCLDLALTAGASVLASALGIRRTQPTSPIEA